MGQTEVSADGSIQGVSFDVPIKKSSWVALRIYPSSHTNPVFVSVGGKPIRASKKSAEWCLKSVDPVLVEEGAGDPRRREGRGQEGVRRRPRRLQEDPRGNRDMKQVPIVLNRLYANQNGGWDPDHLTRGSPNA